MQTLTNNLPIDHTASVVRSTASPASKRRAVDSAAESGSVSSLVQGTSTRSASQTLGDTLARTREEAEFSKGAAALRLGISLRELDHYEAGIRTPSVVTLGHLAALYNVATEHFAVRTQTPRVPPRIDRINRTLTIGWMVIDLSPIDADPAERNTYLLGALGDSLRAMRTLTPAQPVYLRKAELPLLATLLDIDDADLTTVIMRHLALTLAEACDLVISLKQARGF